jgi:DNA-directed RNA polymerase specialized sigma subunit
VPDPASVFSSSGKLEQLSDADLLARYRARPPGDPERDAACDLLVRRFTPLVRACVRPYLNSPEPTEDLMQVGYVGLLKAIRGFDPSFGNELRSYAVPCITGEVKRHFRDRRWQVRIARPAQELLLEMRTATEELTHELGREPPIRNWPHGSASARRNYATPGRPPAGAAPCLSTPRPATAKTPPNSAS